MKGNGIRLILAYGPQEYDLKEVIDEYYQNVMIQINGALGLGDSVCLTGDLNAKLGNEIIFSNIHEISPNGKILRHLVCKYNLSVINATDLCQRTFTRVNNKNTSERSVLDYVIVSEKLLHNVHSVHIDEDKLFTPWRILKKGKKFSDHNAIILNLKITPHSPEASNSYCEESGILTIVLAGTSFMN